MTLYGWDASDFDWGRGPMDLVAAKRDGISFFTHKATESTNVQHGHYGEGLNRARAAGIPFLGPYHVVRTGPISPQVDYFLSYVNAQTPWWQQFPGWFFQADLEKWPYDDVAASLGSSFAAEVERRTRRRCVLYAPQWAYGNSVPGSAPLWASAYGANPAGPYRNSYPGDGNAWQAYSNRTPVILQYGSRATIGSQPGCDINAFRGTTADFSRLIDIGEAPLGGGTEIPQPSNPTPQHQEDDLSAAAEATLAELQKRLDDFDQMKSAVLGTLNAVGSMAGRVVSIQTKVDADFASDSATQGAVNAIRGQVQAVYAAVGDPSAFAARLVAALPPAAPGQPPVTQAQIEAALRTVFADAGSAS